MIGERVALLIGLIVAPAVLLWIGHEFRALSLRGKRTFWGGVIGHTAAMLLMALVMMAPPIWWHGGSFLRDFAVHWSLVIGVLIGAGLGYARGGAGTDADEEDAAALR